MKYDLCERFAREVLEDILSERYRQQEYRDRGRFEFTAQDDTPDYHRLAMLTEELGEVAREIQREKVYASDLYSELIQVAAIACAWCEGILRRAEMMGDPGAD